MNESFDTSAPFGRAMIGILSVFAQLEREQIKERTTMGKLERAKGGLFHGGKFYPIGYDYVDGKLVVNEYEAVQVRNVYDWYLEGTSPEKIAERLRAEGYTNRYSSWIGTSSVRSVLTSEVYLGKIRFGDVVVENAHEPLVTREQFEKVKALMIKRREMFGDSAYKAKYLLSSLIFCARCGSRYFVKYNSGSSKKRRYYCYSRAKTAPQMAKASNCDNKIWKLNELDAIVSAEMKKLFESHAFLESLITEREEANKNKPRKEEDIIRSKIKEYDAQISHLMDLYQNKDMPANVVSARIEKLYSERSALEEQLGKLRPMKAQEDLDMKVITQIIADAGAIWEQADISDKRQILQTFINRIVLDGENIKIEWAVPSHGTPGENA
jgi:site-specific DNA recombinase